MLSILIPAYNAETFIRAAVLSASRQTKRMPVEIVVCDDGSTDTTLEKLTVLQTELPNLRILEHGGNKGVSAARNTLMAHLNAATEFVAFFDADDVYLDGALDSSLSQFDILPETRFTRGRTQVVASSMLEPGGSISAASPVLYAITLSSSVIRADFLAQIGLFDKTLDYGEDFDFLLRMAEATPHRAIHNDIVFYYRRHKTNVTSDMVKVRRGAMRAMLLHAKRKATNPNICDVTSILPTVDPETMQLVMAVNDGH
ncbi:glycosyltransferase family A protein [Devosia sp. MC521]|uniref:glycosyltransferase family 2 protein n=1 Tax=Devosia sp. MC521 TaxID=2759954 RepID=UPI0015FE07C4|nr:glycosyltransferase family A protein [Devosia sp. MC521]MBJ6989241.1 glycosyltransferase family 2 protein [Devosia sp. MC521]QMW63330.1 glycosyltransferase family 2 protein [Devosia sp. MC521]